MKITCDIGYGYPDMKTNMKDILISDMVDIFPYMN